MTPENTIAFMESLRNPEKTDDAGKPFRLKKWQKEYLYKLLGGRYEKSLLFLPKKQGKTTFTAALALATMINKRHRQIKCLSTTKEQASILYGAVASMIKQHDWLSDRSRIRVYRGNQKQIDCYYSDSTLQVLSSDAVAANGFNASDLFYDEICFELQPDLWDAVISGGIARNDLMAIGMSTAGFSTSGFGYQFYEQAKAIQANPEIDPLFLPVIYESPPNDDWRDINSYIKCSPTFAEGGEAAIARIKSMIETAKRDPSELRRLERYHLNRWIGIDAATPWITMDKWDACKGTMNPDELLGRDCFCGLDLAISRDMTAKCLLFPLESGYVAVLMKMYIPADNISDRERRDPGAYYAAWARNGYITATPGAITDYSYIRQDIADDRTKYNVKCVAADPYNGAALLRGIEDDGCEVLKVRQGLLTISPATKYLERLIFGEKLIHFGNPLFRWHIQNATIKTVDNAGNVRPVKCSEGSRIDGIYATLDACAAFMETEANGSVDAGLCVG